MSATIRPVGTLRSAEWANGGRGETSITVNEGQTIEAVCLELGLRPDVIALFLVNGQPESKDYVLRSGDDVKLVALVGGGSNPRARRTNQCCMA